MSPSKHLIVSTGLGMIMLLWLKSWAAAGACFVSGILIDLDHHLDFFWAKNKIPLNYQELRTFCKFDKHGKLFLIFHSYESLIVLWLLIYYLQLNVVWLGIAVGLTVHLFFDQFTNPIKPFFYFFIYRVRVGFERKHLFTKEYLQKIQIA